MAITTYAKWKSRVEASQNSGTFYKSAVSGGNAQLLPLFSSWTIANDVGAAPGATARQCGAATVGNLFASQRNDLYTSTSGLFLASLEAKMQPDPTKFGQPALLLDRLADVSAFSGIVTTAQTANLTPTRYTNGAGNMILVEIYTAIGATATTATVSYTNQAGTAGKTSLPFAIGGAANSSTQQFIIVPLADGDTGVQSVQTISLAATTATAGNFGLTLVQPLAVFPPVQMNGPNAGYRDLLDGGAIIPINSDACGMLMFFQNQSTVGVMGRIGIINGS